VDIAQIRKLIKLVQSSDLTEIEVTEGDQSVRISRQPSGVVATTTPATSAGAVALPQAPPRPSAAPAESEVNEEHTVKSPMVGTYYAAPSPDAEQFVSEGKKVHKGDVLCIIEAMKMMNEIEAEYNGVIDAILLENATPVEYGQPIFIITPLP